MSRLQLRPLSAHEVRDQMIRDYTRNFERISGQAAEPLDIERLVISDLLHTDAAERERRHVRAPVKAQPKKARETLDDKLATLGVARALNATPKLSMLDLSPRLVSERWPFAMARIRRILQPRDNQKLAVKAGAQALTATASYPALAERYWMAFLGHASRTMPSFRWGDAIERVNPYYGLSKRDAARMFIRAIEDICDASTGVLGSWVTK